MSIPTPSAIGKRLTERKQQELQHEADQAKTVESLEKRLAKDSSAKHERTKAANRAKPRSSSVKEPVSDQSRSSSPKTRSSATRSKSAVKATSRPQKDTSKSASTRTRTTTSSTPSATDRPTDSRRNSSNEKSKDSSATPTEKKPFVRKPHLTQRLSSNEALLSLRDSLTPPKGRSPRSKGKQAGRG